MAVFERIKMRRLNRYKRFLIFIQFRQNSTPTEASILINQLSKQNNLISNYLEIGVESGKTLQDVNIRKKFAVDPYFHFNTMFQGNTYHFHKSDSDTFFKKISNTSQKFEIIFLDGLHTFEQTYKDLQNSIKFVSRNSIIIVDDTIPNDKSSSLPDQNACYEMRKSQGTAHDLRWHGDVYKVICALSVFDVPDIHWATLVDLENPKTVIWLENSEIGEWPSLPNVQSNILEKYDFEKCFEPVVNSMFNPMTQLELLNKLKAMNR
jgi:hypothetical protein